MADSMGVGVAQLIVVLDHAEQARVLVRGVTAVERFSAAIEFGDLPVCARPNRTLLADRASADHRRVRFYCTTGQDRTGWAAIALPVGRETLGKKSARRGSTPDLLWE